MKKTVQLLFLSIISVNMLQAQLLGIPEVTFYPSEIEICENCSGYTPAIETTASADCTIHVGINPASTTDEFDSDFVPFDFDFTAGGPTGMEFILGVTEDLLDEPDEILILDLSVLAGTCIIGTPGSFAMTIIDNDGPGLPEVTFSPSEIIICENCGGFSPTVETTASADCTIHVGINPASTADEFDTDFVPFDFDFTAGGPTGDDFILGVLEDILDEPDETLILDLSVLAGTCIIGTPGSFTMTIIDNDDPVIVEYPIYDIAEVTTENADGVADSIGVIADLTGIVYGVNLSDDGLAFTIIDETGGIAVFSETETFGYFVIEGDEVNVKGVISQYNGLTQIEPDELTLISTGNVLKTPSTPTGVNELTESDLIKFESAYLFNLVDPLQWLGDGSSFNVDITDGIDSFAMRIDNNTDLASITYEDLTTGPGGFWGFSVTGLGTQFDTDSPYTDGYQIMPRYLEDLFLVFESIEELDPNKISIYPNPTFDVLNFSGKENIEWVEIINLLGETVQTISINGFDASVDVVNIPAGLYFLKIKTDTGIYSSTFVKQ